VLYSYWIDRMEQVAADAMGQLVAEYWPFIKMYMASMETKERAVNVEGPSQDQRQNVITTRRGIRVVVCDEEVCIYGPREMIRAEWEIVPGILASLRTAFVPMPKHHDISPEQVSTALEMASGFGGEKSEVIFTVDDAKDILGSHEMILKRCPDQGIANEITRLQRVGARKLYRYIENQVISQ